MGQNDFDIAVGTVGGESIVRPRGELDLLTAPALRTAIESVADERVVVDFSGIDFMNSSGLSVLIAATKRLRSKGGDLVVRNAQPMVRKTFEIAGVDELLTIE